MPLLSKHAPLYYICWNVRQEAVALSMALLLSVKFHTLMNGSSYTMK